MPWQTPNLKTVRMLMRDNVVALTRGSSMIPNNVLRIIADASAALAALVLEYIDWLSLQLLPDTAEDVWLDRHGQIWLVNSDGTRGRKGASLAAGSITCTGVPRSIIPIGTQLTAATNTGAATRYETLNQVAIAVTGTATVNVRAITPGAVGNLEPGTNIAFTPTPAGVNGTAAVVSMDGGTDEETTEELRARVLLRIRQPPMGGDATDYVQWTTAVLGVSRAWSFPNEMGIGTITVRFMADELRASDNGFPTDVDIEAVRAYLDTVRPVAVKDFYVEAPIPFPIDVVISNLDNDDDGTRGNILNALQTQFLLRTKPGITWFRAWTDAGISAAAGVVSYDLASTDTVMPSPGYMPVLGEISFT